MRTHSAVCASAPINHTTGSMQSELRLTAQGAGWLRRGHITPFAPHERQLVLVLDWDCVTVLHAALVQRLNDQLNQCTDV